MTHPRPDALLALLTGSLSGDEQAALEAHIDGCDACSARLAEQARLELALYEVAEAAAEGVPVVAAPPPAPQVRWAVFGTLAAAAAALVLVWPTPPEPAAPDEAVTAEAVLVSRCATEPGAACIDEAGQQGLVVGDAIPRYESWAPGMGRYDAPVMP